MKNVLLYLPLLLIRKVILILLAVGIVLATLLYFSTNSPLVIKKLAKSLAPDYNITYDRVHGNILTGIEVENIQFQKNNLAKHIELKWNPNALLTKHISVKTFIVEELNVSVLESLLNSFEGNDIKVENSEANNEEVFIPRKVTVDNLQVTTLPLKFDTLKIHTSKLEIKEMKLDVKNRLIKSAKTHFNATSNLSKLNYSGEIVNNHLIGNIHLVPNKRLYELYNVPFRREAIGNITVDFNASKDRIVADVRANANNLLESKKGEFNINVDDFLSQITYDMHSSRFNAESSATIVTPYANNVHFTNTLLIDEEIHYNGNLVVHSLDGIKKRYTNALGELRLHYKGDNKNLNASLSSSQIKGYFESKDFKKGMLYLETQKDFNLSRFVDLPHALKKTKMFVSLDAPLNFYNLDHVDAKAVVKSDIVNMDTDVTYGKNIGINGSMYIPKNSLIRTYSDDVTWDAIGEIETKVKIDDNNISLDLNNQKLALNVIYKAKDEKINGFVNLDGLLAKFRGKINEKIFISSRIRSIKKAINTIDNLYPLRNSPLVYGDIGIDLAIKELDDVEFSLYGTQLMYEVDKKTKYEIANLNIAGKVSEKRALLESYSVYYEGIQYYSSKHAKLSFDETMKLSNLWVNNALEIQAEYDQKTKKGTFTADAKKFQIKEDIANLGVEVHLKAKIDGNNTNIRGDVILLDGEISPDTGVKSFGTDEDIVILQEVKSEAQSPFMRNLSLMIMVETKNALSIRQPPVNVALKPNFAINKEKGTEILYLGSVGLDEGGSYIFEDKKFTLQKSSIYFTGDVEKPVLDVKATYKSINHLITIAVTGTPEEPNINFSSSPSLTREEILSVILFDSELGGETLSGEEMMKMMGGAMAKAALADAGIKVDHLAFGEGNSIEVGKKLSNNTTVIYVNGVVPKVKLKYEHGKRMESVIGVSEESQSYDIIYKRDF